MLDGDNIRHGLGSNLGFSPEDRTENIRRVGEVAKLFADAGVICITAFISPYRADRDLVRKIMPPGRFIEVFINAPLAVCEQRDAKGLYAKARKNEIKEFTGVSAPYEVPPKPEIELCTDQLSVGESVARILEHLHGGMQRSIPVCPDFLAPRQRTFGRAARDAVTPSPTPGVPCLTLLPYEPVPETPASVIG